jgi:hypothetical protein
VSSKRRKDIACGERPESVLEYVEKKIRIRRNCSTGNNSVRERAAAESSKWRQTRLQASKQAMQKDSRGGDFAIVSHLRVFGARATRGGAACAAEEDKSNKIFRRPLEIGRVQREIEGR